MCGKITLVGQGEAADTAHSEVAFHCPPIAQILTPRPNLGILRLYFRLESLKAFTLVNLPTRSN